MKLTKAYNFNIKQYKNSPNFNYLVSYAMHYRENDDEVIRLWSTFEALAKHTHTKNNYLTIFLSSVKG